MKRNILVLFLFIAFSISINAQQGGYTGPGLTTTTVQQALTLRDDTPVRLQGRIIQFLGDEKYLFEDDTGTVIIEIDNDLWRGLTVNENDLVEIVGEVDRNLTRIEIEVDSIRKL